ncbi:Enolase-phosphatase E1 [Elsinoe australis]|uniref:Enolase-phosphatase E1 n=1 Tax=Elsinoe australis TaxID=40998 RepID=A0A2P7ZAN0_9PEZI|nr:Enolase-phosphatase E1 [Elsinoe australis]
MKFELLTTLLAATVAVAQPADFSPDSPAAASLNARAAGCVDGLRRLNGRYCTVECSGQYDDYNLTTANVQHKPTIDLDSSEQQQYEICNKEFGRISNDNNFRNEDDIYASQHDYIDRPDRPDSTTNTMTNAGTATTFIWDTSIHSISFAGDGARTYSQPFSTSEIIRLKTATTQNGQITTARNADGQNVMVRRSDASNLSPWGLCETDLTLAGQMLIKYMPVNLDDGCTRFPYAISALPEVLDQKWNDPEFKEYKDAFPPEAKASPAAFEAHVKDLMARDVKIAYLKNLQGYLWKSGYKNKAYATTFFPDVVPKLQSWQKSGLSLAIFSSGSVFAQKLLFEHVKTDPCSESNDSISQTDLISAWYDTVNAGPKMEASSYHKIAKDMQHKPENILFLSDNVNEVAAAHEAGMDAVVLDRPGNAPLSEEDRESFSIVSSLDQIDVKATQ